MKSINNSKGFYPIISFFLDALIVYLGFKIAVYIRFGANIPSEDIIAFNTLLPILFLTRLGSLYASGIYRRSFLYPRFLDFSDLLQSWAAGSVILVAAIFFMRILETSRLVLFYEAMLNFTLTAGWRVILWFYGRNFGKKKKAVLISSNLDINRVNMFLKLDGWEYEIEKKFDCVEDWKREDEEAVILSSEFIGENFNVLNAVDNLNLIVAAGERDILLSGAQSAALGGLVVIEANGVRNERHYLAAKRVLDILVSVFGLILLSVPMIAVAVFLKLTSRGTVFFVQKRVGLNGSEFNIFKFRTMYVEMKGGSLTEKGDKRITPFGRFLRKWSIDELPQLINVLFGNMSLVGPRPELPEIAEKWTESRKQVLKVQPGITGLVQVMGRDELTEDEKANLDLFYAMNRSFEMDLSIILKTIRSIVKYRGKT